MTAFQEWISATRSRYPIQNATKHNLPAGPMHLGKRTIGLLKTGRERINYN